MSSSPNPDTVTGIPPRPGCGATAVTDHACRPRVIARSTNVPPRLQGVEDGAPGFLVGHFRT